MYLHDQIIYPNSQSYANRKKALMMLLLPHYEEEAMTQVELSQQLVKAGLQRFLRE